MQNRLSYAMSRRSVVLGALWLTLAWGSSANGQTDGFTALKTDDGILFIWNRPGLGFTLSIKGADIQSARGGDNVIFIVDGRFLQIQSVPIADFVPGARKSTLDTKAILMAHRDWETKFIEDGLHKKISIQTTSDKLPDGTEALIWQYDVPEDFRNADVQTQMYATALAGDYLVLLNSVIGQGGSNQSVRSFLLRNLGTLKFSGEPVDVKKMQEAIRKGQRP